MRASRLTALGITAALAVGGAAPTAASAKAERPGKHTVIPQSTYVSVNAGGGVGGPMFKGETFKVTRISKSGKWARGMAYGHVNRTVWISTKDLKVKR